MAIVALSDSSCNQCCQTESILAQLKELFDEKVYTGKKGKKLKIGRADTSDQHDFLREEGLPTEEVPVIFVMHDSRYFRYSHESCKGLDGTYDDTACILHFINRL